jgi:pimeloyl-ACP methyl ester carboxylesterase
VDPVGTATRARADITSGGQRTNDDVPEDDDQSWRATLMKAGRLVVAESTRIRTRGYHRPPPRMRLPCRATENDSSGEIQPMCKLIWRAAFLLAILLATEPALAEAAHGSQIDLPGVKLWYTDTGGKGVPIVLLHANTGTSATWTKQNEAFAKAGYRVIAFDRRGWGQSIADASTGPQPGNIASDLNALVAALKLEKFWLLGVAGGGFAALDYAAWHQDRLRGLIVGASTGSFSEKVMTDFIQRIAIPGLDRLPGQYIELGLSYRGADPDGTARWIDIEEHARQPGAPAQPLRTPNTFAKVETIAVPTLVLVADADLYAPQALMRVWTSHIRHHDWVVIEDAGHSVAWEQPDAFNAAVLRFLRKH